MSRRTSNGLEPMISIGDPCKIGITNFPIVIHKKNALLLITICFFRFLTQEEIQMSDCNAPLNLFIIRQVAEVVFLLPTCTTSFLMESSNSDLQSFFEKPDRKNTSSTTGRSTLNTTLQMPCMASGTTCQRVSCSGAPGRGKSTTVVVFGNPV